MATQRVIVGQKKSNSGCGTLIGAAILVGLAIEYWYVSLAICVVLIGVWALARYQTRQKALKRPGPKDAWLNEVAVALLALGLTEHGRNTGGKLGGAPLEGDLWLRGRNGDFWINRLASTQLAHQAEMGLRANADFRQTLESGKRALKTEGRLLGIARGRRGVADEILLDEVMRVAGKVPLGVSPVIEPPRGSIRQVASAPADEITALSRLGRLRDEGVITAEEFEQKKRELLKRV